MDETLRQVGELLLGSIPTIVFLVLLYASYTVLVHQPLVKVLAERRTNRDLSRMVQLFDQAPGQLETSLPADREQ